MNDLKESIAKCKKRFKELEHKEWDWSAFYNGWLESFASRTPVENSIKIQAELNYIIDKQKAENKKLRECIDWTEKEIQEVLHINFTPDGEPLDKYAKEFLEYLYWKIFHKKEALKEQEG